MKRVVERSCHRAPTDWTHGNGTYLLVTVRPPRQRGMRHPTKYVVSCKLEPGKHRPRDQTGNFVCPVLAVDAPKGLKHHNT